MPGNSPIYAFTFVQQHRTTTYANSIGNLSCTLSQNDVKINTPNTWGVTQAVSSINVQTRNHDLADGTSGAFTWGNPGTSLIIENINCQVAGGVGYAVGKFVVENVGSEILRIYGVMLNPNGNDGSHISNLSLTKGTQTFGYYQMTANGGGNDFLLSAGERVNGTFDLQSTDDDGNSLPDNLPPNPILEVYSDDLDPNKPQTEIDDYEIGTEDLQSKWDIDVTWSVTPFSTY